MNMQLDESIKSAVYFTKEGAIVRIALQAAPCEGEWRILLLLVGTNGDELIALDWRNAPDLDGPIECAAGSSLILFFDDDLLEIERIGRELHLAIRNVPTKEVETRQ